MNLGYIGDKGQGKSYMLARELYDVALRNKKWHEKYDLPKRMIAVMETLGLSQGFKDEWSDYLLYFNEIQEISKLKECDVFVDDISMRLDSRNWDLLPQSVREWLYGSERLGCDLYFTAQKFSRVEITFRLLTDAVYHCTKSIGSPRPCITKPSIKRVWGIINACSIPKDVFQSESFNQDEYTGGKIVFLRRKYIDMYDHTNISLSEGYAPLTAVIRWCDDEKCPTFIKNGGRHAVVKHV